MDPEDRKLSLLALATAVGGGYLTKVALDQFLEGGPPTDKPERDQDALSETVNFIVAGTAATWATVAISNWIFQQFAK